MQYKHRGYRIASVINIISCTSASLSKKNFFFACLPEIWFFVRKKNRWKDANAISMCVLEAEIFLSTEGAFTSAYYIVPSADNLCKQFGSRSSLIKRRLIWIRTVWHSDSLLNEFFGKKIILKKFNRPQNDMEQRVLNEWIHQGSC